MCASHGVCVCRERLVVVSAAHLRWVVVYEKNRFWRGVQAGSHLCDGGGLADGRMDGVAADMLALDKHLFPQEHLRMV